MQQENNILYITPNTEIEFFKEVYITDIFSTPNQFIFLFEKEKLEEIISLLALISSSFFPVVLKIKYIVDEQNYPLFYNKEYYVFNLLYYVFLTPSEQTNKIYKILKEKSILTEDLSLTLNSTLRSFSQIKEKKIIEKISRLNSFYKKIYDTHTKLVSNNYRVKSSQIDKYKTFYEISQKNTGKERPFDIVDFLSYFINSKKYPFVCFCTDEINDYSSRMMLTDDGTEKDGTTVGATVGATATTVGTAATTVGAAATTVGAAATTSEILFGENRNFTEILFGENRNFTEILSALKSKFLKPFIFLNKKNTNVVSYANLSKYERVFYNKKFFFYIDEEYITESNYSFFLPSKAELLSINQKEIFAVSNESTKIKLHVNRKNKLQGFYNSFDKQVVYDMFDNISIINEYFDRSSVQISEYMLTGNLEFEKEGLVENITDTLFNTFVNLYKPISEERLLFNDESFTSYFERKNPSKFYFNNFFNLIEEEIEMNNQMISSSISTGYSSSKQGEILSIKSNKKSIKNFLYRKYNSFNKKSGVSIIDDYEDDDEDDNIENQYLREAEEDEDPKSLHRLSIENASRKRDQIFLSEITNDILTYIKFSPKSSFIEFKCGSLLALEKLKYNIEETMYHLFEIFKKSLYSSKIKNLLILSSSSVATETEEKQEIVKEQTFPTNFKKLFNIKNYAFNEIIKKKEEISDYSNYCQCNFQPILLNNKMEADDWYNTVYELEGKFFTCKEEGFSPQPNKTGKFLCCKKKEKKETEKVEKEETETIVRKNISSFTPKNKYGELPTELIKFFREIFSDKKKELTFYRKGTGEKFLKDVFNLSNIDVIDNIDTVQSVEKQLKSNIYIFSSNKIENQYLTTEVSPLFPAFNKDWKTLYKSSYILFLVDSHYDFLSVNFKEEKFDISTADLDFVFYDYNKKIGTEDTTNNNTTVQKKLNIKNLTFQFYIFYELCIFFGIKKQLVLGSDEDALTFFTNILKDNSVFSFIFSIFGSSTAFPSNFKIILPKKYEEDLKKLSVLFPVKELYKNFYEDTVSDILKISKNDITIKIPVSHDFFSVNKEEQQKILFLKDLYEFDEYKNKLIFRNTRLVKNNCIFRSNNPNFLFLPSYHRYNLYFNDINYDDSSKCYACDLYTESYIVNFKDQQIKIFHPNLILQLEKEVFSYIIYEFDIYFEKLVKIFTNRAESSNKEISLLYAPFNSIKEDFKQTSKFIDTYIHKKKLIFIPFEFV